MEKLEFIEAPYDTRSLWDTTHLTLVHNGWELGKAQPTETQYATWMYRYEREPGKSIEVIVEGDRVMRIYLYYNCTLIGEYQRVKMALRFYNKYMEDRK